MSEDMRQEDTNMKFKNLPQKEQEIIILKIIGKLTHKEIAEILHTTEHSIKKRYERAIHSLEKCERRF